MIVVLQVGNDPCASWLLFSIMVVVVIIITVIVVALSVAVTVAVGWSVGWWVGWLLSLSSLRRCRGCFLVCANPHGYKVVDVMLVSCCGWIRCQERDRNCHRRRWRWL